MSMSDSVIDRAECPQCGVNVRAGSLFCYNCGGRISGSDESSSVALLKPEPSAVRITTPAPGSRLAKRARPRERVLDRTPKRVVWEPASAGPDNQLIVVTAITTIFTLFLTILAFYLR
jgi:hypothetical protein